MAIRPRLLMGAGIAVAGLGLVGAGAGATFTTQVSASSQISTGRTGLSLNGETGSDLHLRLEGKNLGSHFKPISSDLVLKNTGTLDLASTYLSLTATGCDGDKGAVLAQALKVTVSEVTRHDDEAANHADKVIYDGPLCSMAKAKSGHGLIYPPAHTGVGGQLPGTLAAGDSHHYVLVIQPGNDAEGLPSAAQDNRTSVNLVFSGFDY